MLYDTGGNKDGTWLTRRPPNGGITLITRHSQLKSDVVVRWRDKTSTRAILDTGAGPNLIEKSFALIACRLSTKNVNEIRLQSTNNSSVFGTERGRPFMSDSRAVELYAFKKFWKLGSINVEIWCPIYLIFGCLIPISGCRLLYYCFSLTIIGRQGTFLAESDVHFIYYLIVYFRFKDVRCSTTAFFWYSDVRFSCYSNLTSI